MSDANQPIIDDFRRNNGTVHFRGFGRALVLVHNRGAKSGLPRVNPIVSVNEGQTWLLSATAGGAPFNPSWYYNVKAHPDIEIEYPDDHGGISTAAVTAHELAGAERDAAWGEYLERWPGFAGYEQTTQGRIIPIFRLTRR